MAVRGASAGPPTLPGAEGGYHYVDLMIFEFATTTLSQHTGEKNYLAYFAMGGGHLLARSTTTPTSHWAVHYTVGLPQELH